MTFYRWLEPFIEQMVRSRQPLVMRTQILIFL